MLFIKVLYRLMLILLLILSIEPRPYAYSQTGTPNPISLSTFLQILSDHADCQVEWFASAKIPNFGIDYTFRMRFAWKQGKIRRETYPFENDSNPKKRVNRNYKIVVIVRPGRPPIAIDPQRRTYTETPPQFNPAPFDIDSFIKAKAKGLEKFKFENVGRVIVDGQPATKIRWTIEGETGDISFYLAEVPKNLLIKMEMPDMPNGEKGSLIASNISMDVPDSLFEIPSGYRKVSFNSFMLPLRQNGLR